ncbi:hypothetical protein JB92DRAFT_2829041 [Gautieria morchelliformis]|nr:hypothetical protein JB92DRAFT_2829041 [Gautieria morchelliformis]
MPSARQRNHFESAMSASRCGVWGQPFSRVAGDVRIERGRRAEGRREKGVERRSEDGRRQGGGIPLVTNTLTRHGYLPCTARGDDTYDKIACRCGAARQHRYAGGVHPDEAGARDVCGQTRLARDPTNENALSPPPPPRGPQPVAPPLQQTSRPSRGFTHYFCNSQPTGPHAPRSLLTADTKTRAEGLTRSGGTSADGPERPRKRISKRVYSATNGDLKNLSAAQGQPTRTTTHPSHRSEHKEHSTLAMHSKVVWEFLPPNPQQRRRMTPRGGRHRGRHAPAKGNGLRIWEKQSVTTDRKGREKARDSRARKGRDGCRTDAWLSREKGEAQWGTGEVTSLDGKGGRREKKSPPAMGTSTPCTDCARLQCTMY